MGRPGGTKIMSTPWSESGSVARMASVGLVAGWFWGSSASSEPLHVTTRRSILHTVWPKLILFVWTLVHTSQPAIRKRLSIRASY